jgi:hypothetical protein
MSGTSVAQRPPLAGAKAPPPLGQPTKKERKVHKERKKYNNNIIN